MIEKQLQNIQIKYNSIARPPFYIDINKIYTITLKGNDIYIINGYHTNQINMDVLIKYFAPIDVSWDEILAKDTNNNEKKTKDNDNSIELIEKKSKTEIE